MKTEPERAPSESSVGWLAAIIGIGVALRIACWVGMTWPDTYTYAGIALGGNPVPRFASRYGIVWPVALLQRLFGLDATVLAVYPLLCSAATLVTTWAIGRRLFGEACGRWAAFLLSLTPIELVFGTQLLPDVCAAFWVSLAFLGLILAADGSARWPLILAAVACYIGAQSKETTVALAPCFLWLAWRAARCRGLAWFGAGLLASAACDAAVCSWLWGEPLWKVRAFLQYGLDSNTSGWARGFLKRSIVEILFSAPGSHSTLIPLAVAALAVPSTAGVQRRLLVAWLATLGGFLVACDLCCQKLYLQPRTFLALSVPMAILGGSLLARLWVTCGVRPVIWAGSIGLGSIFVVDLLSGAGRLTALNPLAPSLAGPMIVALALAVAWQTRSASVRRIAAALLVTALGVHAGVWAGTWSARQRSEYEGTRAPLEFLRTLPPGTVRVKFKYALNAAFWSGYRSDLPLLHENGVAAWMKGLSFHVPFWGASRAFDARPFHPGRWSSPGYRVVDEEEDGPLDPREWTLLYRRALRVYLWAPLADDRDRFLRETDDRPPTPALAEARARVLIASGQPGRAIGEMNAIPWEEEPSGEMGLLYEEAAARAGDEAAAARSVAWIRDRELLDCPQLDGSTDQRRWTIGTDRREPTGLPASPGIGTGQAIPFTFGADPAPQNLRVQEVPLQGCVPLLLGWLTRAEEFEDGKVVQRVSVQFLDVHGGIVLNQRWSTPVRAHPWTSQTFAIPRPPDTARRIRVSVGFSELAHPHGILHLDRIHLLRTDADR